MAERRTIGQILMSFGRITEEDVGRALEHQREAGGYFGEALLAMGFVSQEELEWGLASQFDLPYVFPEADSIDPEAAALAPNYLELVVRQVLFNDMEESVHRDFRYELDRLDLRHVYYDRTISSLTALWLLNDQKDLLRWLGSLENPPRQLFVTHGDEKVSQMLADKLQREWNWPVAVPEYQQEYELL